MDLVKFCEKAKNAKYNFEKLSTKKKDEVLKDCAKALCNHEEEIINKNKEDLKKGMEKELSDGLLDRLLLNPKRIKDMAKGLEQIAELPDPIGEILEEFERPNGLDIKKIRVPLGVIGIIYEARPNVTADAFGLCFKTGNAVVLKGGSDAMESNKIIVGILRNVLKEHLINPDGLLLLEETDRKITADFMKMDQYIDVLIPRGGAGLIQSVIKNSTIPVIQTGTGNCHIYIDEFADIKKAIPIIINAKTQRIGVCNACESLVIHEKIEKELLPELVTALKQNKVEMFGDKEAREISAELKEATEEDYGKEYLSLKISMKTVSSIDEAIKHINFYNTKHSESIITENKENAEKFLKEVDAACVYVNASTRFTDGFEFGFGAEIGISTQKLHARGPMGLKELTSYKYCIYGNGQIR